MENHISVETRGDIGIISYDGQVDSDARALKDAVNNLMQSGTFKIIVDFSGITFISSTGWGTIIREFKGNQEKKRRHKDRGNDRVDEKCLRARGLRRADRIMRNRGTGVKIVLMTNRY